MIALYSGYQQHVLKIPLKAKATLITASIGIILIGLFSRFIGQRRKKRKANENGNPQKYTRRNTYQRLSTSPSESRSLYRLGSVQTDKTSTTLGIPGSSKMALGHIPPSDLSPQQLGTMGMEALDTAVSYWEDALAAYTPDGLNQLALTNVQENNFTHQLEAILDSAYQLQRLCSQLFLYETSILFQGKLSESRDRYSESDRRTVTASFSSAESFVSAQAELADMSDFDEFADKILDIERLPLYKNALELAAKGDIPFRILRMDLLRCSTEVDFLAKVHCVRLAFQYLFEKPDPLGWFVNVGGQLLTDLLIYAEKDPKVCQTAYDEMINFIQDQTSWPIMEEELEARGVHCLSFFDVVLDYMLMDAFDDLDDPPTSVKAVVQNRWLSNGFKESALSTAVWSVLQAKRRRLKYTNGFSSHFYAISEHITPVLAWGFLGPNEDLKEICTNFKNEVEGFIQDIFNLHKVRYTNIEELSEDILVIAKERFEILSQKISL